MILNSVFFLSNHTFHTSANLVYSSFKIDLKSSHESPPPWLPCKPSRQVLLPYVLQKYPRYTLSVSVKMKVKAFHWSSLKSLVAFQVSLWRPARLLVLRRPLLLRSHLLPLPCPLSSIYTRLLAVPVTCREYSSHVFAPTTPSLWHSLAQISIWTTPSGLYSKITSAMKPFLTDMKMQPTLILRILTLPLFSLHCT